MTASSKKWPGLDDPDLGPALVEAILRDYPDHSTVPPLRPVHSFGMGASGVFHPSEAASQYCTAEHFTRASTPVVVRFSNGSGAGTENDDAQDVHGLAVKFHLDGGAATDLIAMTLNGFFVSDVEEFFELSTAGRPQPVAPETWWKKILDTLSLRRHDAPVPASRLSGGPGLLEFADTHRRALPGVIGAATIYRPSSWARAAYHAVHTFGLHGADGVLRWVRFHWEPTAGVHPIPPGHDIGNYDLRGELGERLERGTVRFLLRLQIGEADDPIDDPTAGWPLWRPTVVMGTLVLDSLVQDQENGCERLSFNPARLPPGMEMPRDQIIAARKVAYESSCTRRNGIGCPMGFSVDSTETT